MSEKQNKVTIVIAEEDRGKCPDITVEAQYNPESIGFKKSVNWDFKAASHEDFETASFTQGSSIELSLELLFDEYETRGDVRGSVGNIMKMCHVVDKDSLPRPPMVRFQWGSQMDPFGLGKMFTCVLTGADVKYTMFLEDGTPCRATVNVSFKQTGVVEGAEAATDRQPASEPKSAAELSNSENREAAYEANEQRRENGQSYYA